MTVKEIFFLYGLQNILSTKELQFLILMLFREKILV